MLGSFSGVEMKTAIYIARHERNEAAEAYADHLTNKQKEHLRDNDADFWLYVFTGAPAELLMIDDEG